MAGTSMTQVRLALRNEGEFVNAYAALGGTMDGAILMGSLRKTLAADNRVWFRWKSLMTDLFRAVVKDAFGVDVETVEQPAPEHERAGHA